MPGRAASRTSGTPKMLRILAPPLAGKPARLRRSSTRLNPAPCASLVFKTEERQMLTIAHQIRELRAELTGCLLTRRERAQAQAS